MTITYHTGDLMKAEEVAIAHGCNTVGRMGAGVARLVRDKFPAAYHQYQAACASMTFHVGTAQAVWIPPGRIVYNLGTQRHPGADATVWGVFLAFANMAEDAYNRGISTIAIPRIGCGIGGLTWAEVEPAIAEAIDRSSHTDLTIAVYTPKGTT
jgi:O-acetyl-ADP-ribose deacetylase (regulator of RNase III)